MIIYLGSLPASSIITSNIPRSAGTWHSYHARPDLTQKYTNIHFQCHLLFSHLPLSCKFLYSLRTKVATQSRSQLFLIVTTCALVWSLKYTVILHFPGTADGLGLLQHFTAENGDMVHFLSLHQYLWGVCSITWCFSNLWMHQILPGGGGLLEHRLLGPSPRVSHLTGLGRSLRICISNKLSVLPLLCWSRDYALRSIGQGLQWWGFGSGTQWGGSLWNTVSLKCKQIHVL